MKVAAPIGAVIVNNATQGIVGKDHNTLTQENLTTAKPQRRTMRVALNFVLPQFISASVHAKSAQRCYICEGLAVS